MFLWHYNEKTDTISVNYNGKTVEFPTFDEALEYIRELGV